MWKFLVILSCFAVAQGCRVIELKANGVQIQRGAFPSHVLVEKVLPDFKTTSLCSGVLISTNHVLTTRQCVAEAEVVNLHIYPFQLRDEFEEKREIYRSSDFILHTEYNETTFVNDVAIVKLPVTLNLASKPYTLAVLPTTAPTAGTSGSVVGWGLFNFKDDNAASSTQSQTMSVLSASDCSAKYPEILSGAAAGRGCVSRLSGLNCVSDSGSPFMVGNVVHGIFSFGQEQACETAEFPNGIQVVADHLIWIKDAMGKK